jgi:recombination protein RecA
MKKRQNSKEETGPTKESARNIKIEDTLREIKTKFGDEAIMKLGEAPKVDVGVIPTGSIGLDAALGVGGLPRGRIIEIFGPESSGKTTLALHAVAESQKQGGICAFIDAEHALDPEYAKRLGVKIDELLISQPDNGEQALEIVESLVRTGKIDIVAIDSVAALTPKDEIEGDMGAYHVVLFMQVPTHYASVWGQEQFVQHGLFLEWEFLKLLRFPKQ